MPSDPSKPLIKLTPRPQEDRNPGRQRFSPRPAPFSGARQQATFGPKFDRLADVLARDPNGLELRADPTALAPERLLVFEVRGTVAPFAAAVRRVRGLELIDEEELESDEQDKNPVAYLLVPDSRALREIESLWRRWRAGQELGHGNAAWKDVFSLLRDLRPWGPSDRVQDEDANFLNEEIFGHADEDLIKLEVELVFRPTARLADEKEEEIRAAIVEANGRIVSRCRIEDIAYHAVLVELPVSVIREITERSNDGIAGLEPVMHIRPQSTATTIEVADTLAGEETPRAGKLAAPILAMLDGVPVGEHRLLDQHLIVDDLFDLEPTTPVAGRIHGSAVASLIVHGDRNRAGPVLHKRVHVVPVLGADDAFPPDLLVVDVVYRAVISMRAGREPTAPNVLIVNLSLGNSRRPFHGQLSPWARLLDRLSYQFGILFFVSAGNVSDPFEVPAFATSIEFEDAPDADRAAGVLTALGNAMGIRRLLAPAETINGITVGASNDDSVSPEDRRTARVNVNPYPTQSISNPSSAMGPGFSNSVKPDIIMPGGREHLHVIRSDGGIVVAPSNSGRFAGLRVASPPRAGQENAEGFTSGTSAATALASRTCHRIYDALEEVYGAEFTSLPHLQRAVLLKALVAHPAKWSPEAASLIRQNLGPADPKQHIRQKDNIRRFLGYGFVDAEEAVACAADRATFWATGVLQADKKINIEVPVPGVMNGRALPHALFATLSWFTPVAAGRRAYRTVRLKLIEPDDLDALKIKSSPNQPDANQSSRGTTFTRCWSGERAPAVEDDMSVTLVVQREPDQGVTIDDAIPFGLAVTLTMPGVVEIYDQVRQRVAPPIRA